MSWETFSFLCCQVRAGNPDLWLWLGDNVYNDGTDMDFKRKRSEKDLFLNQQTVPASANNLPSFLQNSPSPTSVSLNSSSPNSVSSGSPFLVLASAYKLVCSCMGPSATSVSALA